MSNKILPESDYEPVSQTENYTLEGPPKSECSTRRKNRIEVIRPKWILRQQEPNRVNWDLFVMLLASYNCFSIPFGIAFEPSIQSEPYMYAMDGLIDFLFAIDIVLNFRTSFLSPKTGIEEMDPKNIAKNYVYGGKFIIDLLATIPFDTIAEMMNMQNNILRVFGILKLVRVLRLSKIISYMRVKEDVKMSIKLLQLLLFLFMYVHIIGCIWWMLVKGEEVWISTTDSLAIATNVYRENIWKKYFISFYTSLFFVVGIEINPNTMVLYIFCATMILAGAMITAVLFGEIAVVMDNLNRKSTRFNELMDSANTTMKNLKLPEPLQLKIYDYLIATQSILAQKEEYERFQQIIPPSFQKEVNAELYKSIVQKNDIIGQNPRAASFLINNLKNSFQQPERIIFDFGDQADDFYCLATGSCEVFVPDIENEQRCVRILQPGDMFGEVALLYKTNRTATIITQTYSKVAILSEHHFSQAIKQYPALETSLRQKAGAYKDYWRQFLKRSVRLVPYMRGLKKDKFNIVIYSFQPLSLAQGDELINPGDQVNSMYIVLDGELEVTFEVKGKSTKLSRNLQKSNSLSLKHVSSNNSSSKIMKPVIRLCVLKKGSIIGFSQMLVSATSSVKYEALKTCQLLELKMETLEMLCKYNHELKVEVDKYKKTQLIWDNEHQDNLINSAYLDIDMQPEIYDDSHQYWVWKNKLKLQNSVLTIIHRKRNLKAKGIPNISAMLAKLRAMIEAEETGQDYLVRMIARGEVPPEAVYTVGLLKPEEYKSPILTQFGVTAKQSGQMAKTVEEYCLVLRDIAFMYSEKVDLAYRHFNDLQNSLRPIEAMLGLQQQRKMHFQN